MDVTNKIILLPSLRGTKIENVSVNTLNVAFKDVEIEPQEENISDGMGFFNDLNNIISNIHGESQLIDLYVQNENISDNEPLTKSIDLIRKNCLKLTKALNNMIKLKKIKEKQLCLCANNVNIVEIIDDIVMCVSENINEKKIIFDTDIEEKYIICDISKLQKAILILLSNAVRFSSEIELNVNLKAFKNNVNITISFKNRNKNLFDFFIKKMDNFSESCLEDLSVGFYICNTIIKLHEGHIDLLNNGDEISFLIQLPCVNTDSIYNLLRDDKILNNANLTEQIQIEFSDLPH